MSELLQHLKQEQYCELFPAGEFTNATNFLYTALLSAVADNADTIIIKQNGFEWYKADNHIGSYLGKGTLIPSPTFNIIIYQVLRHDGVVSKYMNVLSADTEHTVLSIDS